MHIHPLGDEIGERMRPDRVARPKVDGIGARLDRPFNNAAAGFLVVEDVAERVLGRVAELLGCDQDGIQQFLDLWVVSLRLV